MYCSLTFRSLCPQNVMRFQIIRSLYPQKRDAFSDYMIVMPPKRGAFSDYTIVMPPKRDTFCVFIIIKLVFGGAYAIRPYTGPQKINAFSRSIMYQVNFPGLGRGLDFLLPSFLSSRKEKKVGAWGQSPRFLYHKISISGK